MVLRISLKHFSVLLRGCSNMLAEDEKENIFMKGPKPDQRTMLYFLRVCLHKCVLEYSQSVKE